MLHYYILKQDYWSPKLLSYLNLQKCIALEKKAVCYLCKCYLDFSNNEGRFYLCSTRKVDAFVP